MLIYLWLHFGEFCNFILHQLDDKAVRQVGLALQFSLKLWVCETRGRNQLLWLTKLFTYVYLAFFLLRVGPRPRERNPRSQRPFFLQRREIHCREAWGVRPVTNLAFKRDTVSGANSWLHQGTLRLCQVFVSSKSIDPKVGASNWQNTLKALYQGKCVLTHGFYLSFL